MVDGRVLGFGWGFCKRQRGREGRGREGNGTVEFGVGGGCEVGDEGGERGAVTEGGAEHGVFVCSVLVVALDDERRADFYGNGGSIGRSKEDDDV